MAKVTIVLEDDFDEQVLRTDLISDPPFDIPEGAESINFENMTPAQTFGIMAKLFLEQQYRKAETAEAEAEEQKQMELPLES